MAQTAEIRIVSPKDGTVVAPGAVLQVTVEATPFVFEGVILAGRPIGFSDVILTPPYRYFVRIHENASAGPDEVNALGGKPGGGG
jgi:hypothetical protein